MGNAIARRDNYSCSPKNLTQNNSFVTDEDVRRAWKCAVIQLPRRQLSEIAHVTKQAASLWCNGERAPSTATLFNLARNLPSIQGWGAAQMGVELEGEPSLDSVERMLHALAARNDFEGRAARQLLIGLYSIRTQSDEPVPPMVRVAWDFDLDNRCKAVLDFLVHHKIIEDDNRTIVREIHLEWGDVHGAVVQLFRPAEWTARKIQQREVA